MSPLATVCVFCGSNPGRRPEYIDATQHLASLLVRQGIRVVYGGANVGTMGVLADAVLRDGGEILGVIPGHLADAGVAHQGLSQLRLVDSLHERKALMVELSDAFIALPGGFGTLEELAEVITWSQLGLHTKPTGLLNTLGYFDSLLAFLDHAMAELFVRPQHRAIVVSATTPEELMRSMAAWRPPTGPKWMDAAGAALSRVNGQP